MKQMVSPQDLAPLMAAFGKAYTRKIFAEMGRAGTTPARGRLLATLQFHGSCKMSEIIDRRASMIRLTPAGILVSKESMHANHAMVTELFERLTAADRQHLSRILKKLIDVLDEEAKSE
jgi:DNA-binding MarR family transcriptional regulator